MTFNTFEGFLVYTIGIFFFGQAIGFLIGWSPYRDRK